MRQLCIGLAMIGAVGIIHRTGLADETRVQEYRKQLEQQRESLPKSGDLSAETAAAVFAALEDHRLTQHPTLSPGEYAALFAKSYFEVTYSRNEGGVRVLILGAPMTGGYDYAVGLPDFNITSREGMR